MKELSIEEKAQRYDEAIKKAKDMLSYKEVRREDMEYLFPELKESEDERIRKALMQNLKERFGTKGNMGEGLDMPDVLAWLEKQGEQKQEVEGNPNARKPTLKIIKGKSYLCIKDYRDKNCTFTKGKIYKSDKDGFLVDDEEKDTFERKIWEEDAIEYFFLFEQSKTKNVVTDEKQKPADDIERKYNPSYNMSFEEAQEYISNRGFDIPWIDCDVFVDFRYVTQTVANVLCWADDNPKQKPAAWSEEDDEMLNLIIARLHSHPNIDLEEYSKEYDWLNYRLKSLKPQNTWKPSEEQMKALDEARSLANNCGEESAFDLRTLYEQLKKLREE